MTSRLAAVTFGAQGDVVKLSCWSDTTTQTLNCCPSIIYITLNMSVRHQHQVKWDADCLRAKPNVLHGLAYLLQTKCTLYYRLTLLTILQSMPKFFGLVLPMFQETKVFIHLSCKKNNLQTLETCLRQDRIHHSEHYDFIVVAVWTAIPHHVIIA